MLLLKSLSQRKSFHIAILIFFIVSLLIQLAPWRTGKTNQEVYHFNEPSICDTSSPPIGWVPFPERVWTPQDGLLSPVPLWVPKTPNPKEWKPTFCIVARTYRKQAPSETFFGVDKFLASILSQTNPNWFLILLDTEPHRDFPYLTSTLQEWVSRQEPFRIKIMSANFKSVNPDEPFFENPYNNLHRRIYWHTDEAMRSGCPASSEYFIATNADNWYHEKFLETVLSEATNRQLDLVGVDFSTRHAHWIWGIPDFNYTCKVFEKFPPIVCNGLTTSRTDLGSLVFNATRFRQESLSFSRVLSQCASSPSYADGCMAQALRAIYKWRFDRVPVHLFSHAPDPWTCFLHGGVLLRQTHGNPRSVIPNFKCMTRDQLANYDQQDLVRYNIPYSQTSCYQDRSVIDSDPLAIGVQYRYNGSERVYIGNPT